MTPTSTCAKAPMLHRAPRRHQVVLVGVLLAVAAAVGGCGVPLDSSPRVIPRTTTVESGPGSQQQTPTTSGSPTARTISAYFLRDEGLQRVLYRVEGEPTLSGALAFVCSDPPEALKTSIPTGTRILSAHLDGHVAIIDVTSAINDISGLPQKQAYAQMVFTALAFSGVSAVEFHVDGKAVDAPTDNGNRTQVTDSDYRGALNPLGG